MPGGTYDDSDLRVVVDNVTLSTADYNWSFADKLLTLVNTTPQVGTQNVVVTYKHTEFDGRLNTARTLIRTPFGEVTATAGPSFAFQQGVLVTRATSLLGFINDPGQVLIAEINGVVKITFEYEVIDTVLQIATVSTPTAVGAGKSRKPTGTETDSATSTFTSTVALFTLDDLNAIDAAITATPTLTVNGLLAALDATGDLGVRVAAAATAVGLTTPATDLASAFQDLTVPIRDGEPLTVTYADAAPAATVTAPGTIDLALPTITVVQPSVDSSFAKVQSTLSLTVADSGVGLTLAPSPTAYRRCQLWSGQPRRLQPLLRPPHTPSPSRPPRLRQSPRGDDPDVGGCLWHQRYSRCCG